MTASRLDRHLATYACFPELSGGRLHLEPESPTRSCFQRDRDRIIHSGAFRRLKHKTQVFVYHEGDYYRTRLTHSLEVSQIARSLCRQLGLNEDLAEALALAHDLGHTCFGHAGEAALDKAMAPFGGFDHNEQTFRIVTLLEQRYAEFDGLNLTWETLEGLVKHNGPLPAGKAIPESIAAFQEQMDLRLSGYASAEAQIAALADDIAYTNHDIDDGLRAELFAIEDLLPLPLLGDIVSGILARYPGLEASRLIHESVRRLIDLMVTDLLVETRRRLEALAPATVEEIRGAERTMVEFSEGMQRQNQALRDFLFQRMYRHPRVNAAMANAKEVVQRLFAHYRSQPEALPDDWQALAAGYQERQRARLVADYIAGMTDRYALMDYERIFQVETVEF